MNSHPTSQEPNPFQPPETKVDWGDVPHSNDSPRTQIFWGIVSYFTIAFAGMLELFQSGLGLVLVGLGVILVITLVWRSRFRWSLIGIGLIIGFMSSLMMLVFLRMLSDNHLVDFQF